MYEDEGTPMTNAELGQYAVGSVLKMMAIKWAVIIVVTKLAQRAVRNMDKP